MTKQNPLEKAIESAWNRWNAGECSFVEVQVAEFNKLRSEGVPAKYWQDILFAKKMERDIKHDVKMMNEIGQAENAPLDQDTKKSIRHDHNVVNDIIKRSSPEPSRRRDIDVDI